MKTTLLLTVIFFAVLPVSVKGYSEGITFTGLGGTKSVKSAVLGKPFVVDCSVDNKGVEEVMLYREMPRKGKQRVRMDGKVYKRKGNMFEVTLEDVGQGGKYYCAATLYGTIYEEQLHVLVIGNLKDLAPKPSVIPSLATVDAGEQLTISCESKGLQTTLSWYKEGKRLEGGGRTAITRERVAKSGGVASRLIIHSVTRSDTGTYVCRATSSLAEGYFALANAKIYIREYTPFVKKDESQMAKIGSRVVLDCSSTMSNGAVEFYYQTHKDYLRILTNGTPGMKIEKGKVELYSVALKDMGIYVCKANGQLVKKISLFVMQDPENVCKNFNSRALQSMCKHSKPEFMFYLKRIMKDIHEV